MDVVIHPAPPLRGRVSVPPDKAICHRAVLAAALASGTTTIRPWPEADDCQRTLALVERLGVRCERIGETVVIAGAGADGVQAPTEPLDCGESGTTLRLAAGLLAGWPFTSQLTAGPSLSRRPMRRIIDPLTRMGASLEGVAASRELYAPLTVRGMRPLRAIQYELPVASAQVKSAVLLAGLSADGRSTVVETVPTRDHTERILRVFGIPVDRDEGRVSVQPGGLTSPGELRLPGDVSSAAFWLVAAACIRGSHVELLEVGLNPTRTGLVPVLQRMGAELSCRLEEDRWEPRGTITVTARPLRATTVAPTDVPGLIDELPILMVAAACAEGTTRLRGIGELRVKETDRIRSLVDGLERLGARIRLAGSDVVEIRGAPLSGNVVDSAGDHRTAMSLSVAALVAQGETTIRGAECVAKSYPTFFQALRQLAGSSTVKTVDNPRPLC